MTKTKNKGIVNKVIDAIMPKATFKNSNGTDRKYVSVHFTLKGTDWKEIQKALHMFRDGLPEEVVLVNAFMSLPAINNSGFDPKVRTLLDTLFPEQENFYHDETGPDREGMIEFLKDKDCVCFFIKPIIEGVKEEYDLVYEEIGPDVIMSYPSEQLVD